MAKKSSLRRPLALVRPDLAPSKGLIGAGCVAMLADVAFRVLEPWPMKIIIDSVLEVIGPGGYDRAIGVRILIACAVLHLVIVICRAGGNFLATLSFSVAGAKMAASLRARVFQHVQGLEQQFHARNRSADTVQRIVGDIARIQDVSITAGLPLIANSLTLVVMVIVMVILEPLLAVVVLITLGVFALISLGNSPKITAASRRTRQQEGNLANTAQESLAAIPVIQAYGLESLVAERFLAANAISAYQGVKAQRLAARLERGTDVLIGAAIAIVLLVGGFRVLDQAMTAGDLVLFVSYLRTTMKPMRDMAKYTGRVSRAGASAERIADLLDIRPKIVNPSNPVAFEKITGKIDYERVVVKYEDREVLHGVSLSIAAGEKVAIVGPSGAGKSTLISLLVRAIDPQSGQVLIDGRPLHDVDLHRLRETIALLHQEAVLFVGSIAENIALGRPGASQAEIEEAAKAASAHDFITSLAEGYQTVVGERGGTLSGGQRQRIAIARALLREAPIILLDEATTGLDPESAQAVMDAFDRLVHGRTALVVTHDSEVAVRCERVIWVEDGQVRLDGSPQELLASSELFRSWVSESSDKSL